MSKSKRSWKGKRGQHAWDYMGVAFGPHGEGVELTHCECCNKFKTNYFYGPKFISRKKYQEIVIEGSWNW